MSGIQHTAASRSDPSARPGAAGRSNRGAAGASLRTDLQRAIEHEIVPRLLSLHGDNQPGGAFLVGTPEFSARLSVELALDSVGAHPDRVGAWLERLLEGGADPADLCLHVLAPAARHLGQLWVEDRLDFVDVTLGTMRLERSLRGLLTGGAPVRRPRVRVPTILMMPLPGNQHTFGLTMAADFFRRAGWAVSDGTACAAPGTAPGILDGLEHHLRSHALDAIGLAVSCEVQAERLTAALRMVRAASLNPRIRIALGGPLFLVQPGMAARFDADLVVTDGAQAPTLLAALLPDCDARRGASRPAASAAGSLA